MLRKEYAENPFQKEEYGRLLKLAQGRRNQKQFCEDAGLSRSYSLFLRSSKAISLSVSISKYFPLV